MVGGLTIETSTPLAAYSLLRLTINFHRRGRRILGNRVIFRSAIHGAGRGIDYLADSLFERCFEKICGAPPVDRPEQLAVVGKRIVGNIVENDIHSGARLGYHFAVADIPLNQLDARVRG